MFDKILFFIAKLVTRRGLRGSLTCLYLLLILVILENVCMRAIIVGRAREGVVRIIK